MKPYIPFQLLGYDDLWQRPDRKQVTAVIYSIIMTQSSVSPILCPKSMYQKCLCCWKCKTPNHHISNAGKHQETHSKLNYNIPQLASSAQGQTCLLVKICFAFCNTVATQAVIITNCTAERLSYIQIACFALYGGKHYKNLWVQLECKAEATLINRRQTKRSHAVTFDCCLEHGLFCCCYC